MSELKMTTAEDDPTSQRKPQLTFGRAIQRSILTITFFICAMIGLATLMHAGIDPRIEGIQAEGSLLNTLTRLAAQL
ncbi:MAG: hypothetical protein AAFR75_00820 [Pseudomonadota bacterium]